MTRYLIAAAVIGMAQPVAAQQSVETCMAMSELAENIMMRRQEGASIRDMLTIATSLDDDMTGLAVALVEAAFNQPRYSTQQYQLEAASEFGASIYNVCRSEGA